MKVIHCSDVGFDCGYVARADSEEELLGKVAQHASEAHGVTEVTPELVDKVRGVMRTE